MFEENNLMSIEDTLPTRLNHTSLLEKINNETWTVNEEVNGIYINAVCLPNINQITLKGEDLKLYNKSGMLQGIMQIKFINYIVLITDETKVLVDMNLTKDFSKQEVKRYES